MWAYCRITLLIKRGRMLSAAKKEGVGNKIDISDVYYLAHNIRNMQRRYKMNTKRSGWILGLLLIALTLSSCATMVAQADDGWETYTNETHGYSLSYPGGCTVGPLPAHCKASPPEERPDECMCFLNAETPDQLMLQTFIGEKDSLTLATFLIFQGATPEFSPPADAELIPWMEEHFSNRYEELPKEPNIDIGGIPAARIHTPGSPGAYAYDEVYFIKDTALYMISMVDVENEHNRELYGKILGSIEILK
jgi:hypothetical protein